MRSDSQEACFGRDRNLRESIEKQRIEQTYMYINTGIHSENVGIKKNEILCRKMNELKINHIK